MVKGERRGGSAGGMKEEQLQGMTGQVKVRERDESGNDGVGSILHIGDAARVTQSMPQNEKHVGGSEGRGHRLVRMRRMVKREWL